MTAIEFVDAKTYSPQPGDRPLKYKRSPTLAKFHASDAFVRGVRGPYNSGKSTAMCWEIFLRAKAQVPAEDGVRRTRWLVVRNTYPELRDTTIKTWLYWFREDDFGKFNWSTMTHHLRVADLDCEVMFRSLDKPGDIGKVLSMELTGAWINEAREIYTKGLIDAVIDRTDRFPAIKDGGCTWSGVIMDTNAPDDDHWWFKFSEEDRPKGWEFFTQPPGVIEDGHNNWKPNPDAENLENIAHDYYMKRVPGKSRDYILVYYCNQYGFVQEGKPIYPEYLDHVHAAQSDLEPVEGIPIYVGIDFGLTPAAVFGQRLVTGAWRWFDELVTEDMGAVRFAEVLGPILRNRYAGFDFEIYGDPAGDDRAQTDEETPIAILNSRGIPCTPAPSNDPVLRREAVAVALNRMIDGTPGLMISPKCKFTRKGMAGGYHYKRVQVLGEERYHDRANKNRFSHPCEAAQYMMLGAGEGETVIPDSGKFWDPLDDYYTEHDQAII